MKVRLAITNHARERQLYRRDRLTHIAETACRRAGIAGEVEISLLFCDDREIEDLNARYRNQQAPTDVLSFGQEDMPRPDGMTVLGDVVISLETVVRRCKAAAGETEAVHSAAQREVRLLFCHGVLHLLGYDHGSAQERERMAAVQSAILGIPLGEAWIGGDADGHTGAR